jgi:proline iminopeptidase
MYESTDPMTSLYPEILPYHIFFLKTGSKHSVYVEQSGNPDGFPVIFLHGGPCSGTKPDHRRFFNPQYYRIILFDQRGCGLSLPFGELEHNTTQDLIDDMERIRQTLNINQWLVFGGSWGAALALLYAQQHTEHVSGLIIRAVFLARKRDMDWFIKDDGVRLIYPEQWQRLMTSMPEPARENPIQGLCDVLWGDDEIAVRRVAREWMAWGAQIALGHAYQGYSQDSHVTDKMVRQVRMELHYAKNQYFIAENQILNLCHKLMAISTIIIHGRNDLVCPMEAGMMLHQALPHAGYVVLPNAGHIAQGDDMINVLVTATDNWICGR